MVMRYSGIGDVQVILVMMLMVLKVVMVNQC